MKILLMLITLFAVSVSAKGPLRFKNIVVKAKDLDAVEVTIQIEGGIPNYTYTLLGHSHSTDSAAVTFSSSIHVVSEQMLPFTAKDGNGTVIIGTLAFIFDEPFRVGNRVVVDFTHPSYPIELGGIIKMMSSGYSGLYAVDDITQPNCYGKRECVVEGKFPGPVFVEINEVLAGPKSIFLAKIDLIEVSTGATDDTDGLDDVTVQ